MSDLKNIHRNLGQFVQALIVKKHKRSYRKLKPMFKVNKHQKEDRSDIWFIAL
jgi:hypothetical protein